MERNIKIYTISCLVFLILLCLSGSFGGLLGEALYFLAFILPSAMALLAARREVIPPPAGTRGARLVFSAAPLCLFSIFAFSYLTALVIFLVSGKENPSSVTGEPLYDIPKLALLPALFEELLFRYVPQRLIAPYSKKSALVISALFFGLVHGSFFSIPYAIFAGASFMGANILAGSILPSVILHFSNNLISILYDYAARSGGELVFALLFAVSALVSLVFVIIYRKEFSSALEAAFEKSDRVCLPRFAAALIIPTLLLALLNIL